jgi:hypothetical protein
MVASKDLTVTFADERPGPSEDLGDCAGCFLAVVRNARALATRLASPAHREALLALLAEGEIAAMTTFGVALGEPREDSDEKESRDAFRVIEAAAEAAASVLDSLGVRVRVRTDGRRVPLAGSIAGLARALAVAIASCAVRAGRGGSVLVTYTERRGKLALIVRAEGGESRGPVLSFSPVSALASWLRREKGTVRVGDGKSPGVWWFERPLSPAPTPTARRRTTPSLISAPAR